MSILNNSISISEALLLFIWYQAEKQQFLNKALGRRAGNSYLRETRALYLELVEILVFLLEGILIEAEIDAVLREYQLRSYQRLARFHVVKSLRFFEGEFLAWSGCRLKVQRATRTKSRTSWRRKLGRCHRRSQRMFEHGSKVLDTYVRLEFSRVYSCERCRPYCARSHQLHFFLFYLEDSSSRWHKGGSPTSGVPLNLFQLLVEVIRDVNMCKILYRQATRSYHACMRR